ncbi:hypothetical protein MATL_G00219210 [Megalops atlanticus]|uniref:Uncharacterized protein n=1 Tax=Megalops atlanticus TaxID=7932 RepID=A0A9D3SZU5_MEGAT|nr:hypothetical protein MATL_G00219210 [Megalops atlanticus]
MQNQWNPQHQQVDLEMRIVGEQLEQASVFLSAWIFSVIISNIWGFLKCIQIILGTLYLQECPYQPHLPLFLIMTGGLDLLINFLYNSQRPSHRQDPFIFPVDFRSSALRLFQVCWFIAGNMTVFSMSTPSSTPGDPQYCDRKLYLFSIFTIIATYIFTTLLLMGFCILNWARLNFSRLAFRANRQWRYEQHWRGAA